MMVMDLLLATSNPHKLEELRAILAHASFASPAIRLLSLNDLPGARACAEPAETGATFEDNARIKALAYARMTGLPCLADDSGLEVDALRGLPGVHSAYYAFWSPDMPANAAPPADLPPRAERDRLNNEKLLRELDRAGATDPRRRAARFVCAMALASPDAASPDGARILAVTRGEFPGVIGSAPRGSNGFGYDPLLVLEDGRTSAELSPEEKNARSHRGAAARAMARRIAECL